MNTEQNERGLDAAMTANADEYHKSEDYRIEQEIHKYEKTPSKGPWTVALSADQSPDEYGICEWHSLYDSDEREIATVYREVDARLIAAAPDLLTACTNAHKCLSDQYAADCQQADWHNNNTPGVGQTVDYMNYPPRPAELDHLASAIAKATQP